METKYTNGNWEVKDCHDDTRTAEIKADGKNIATVWAYNNGSKVIDFNEQQANAKLIASAPDMLKAAILCESITDKCNNAMLPKHIQELLKSINETLTKAINHATN